MPTTQSIAIDAHANFARDYPASEEGVRRATRELAAFALCCGLGPTPRTRIATAACEALDNAARHAYAGRPGRIVLSARLSAGRFELSVEDQGRGFAATAALAASRAGLPGAGDGGLARCAALCEDLRIESTTEGTRIDLCFELAPAIFEEDACAELSERDYLEPEVAKRLLCAVRSGCAGDNHHLSPAMAVTLGRLLAGASHERVRQIALWS